ncbi:hypothetical protein [Streptomyces bottropensis]|uniref:hypothetical protein n=1 Tax=Streptomyces bottropensis TaxID=42235 RepID=UPI0036CDA089
MGSFLFLVLALAPFLAPSVVAATTSALAVRAHGREKGGGRRLEQGIGTELVPDRVNPTVYGGITLGTLALGAAVFRGRRRTPH